MKFKFWLPLTILFIIIDQLTKLAASQLNWPIFYNYQFAFSLPVPPVIMYAIYFCVMVGMTWYVKKNWKNFNTTQILAWAFVYAGGVSNICERIVLGYVRDFIPISSGTLNVADFFILIGLVLLLISNRISSSEQKSETLN